MCHYGNPNCADQSDTTHECPRAPRKCRWCGKALHGMEWYPGFCSRTCVDEKYNEVW